MTEDMIVIGRIVTMDADRRVIDGAMAVVGGRIALVGDKDEVERAHPNLARLHGDNGIIMPGLVDAHTHLTQGLVRGLVAHELPMIYRLYLPATLGMQTEEASTAAQLCIAQLLKSGVTTVGEGSIGASDAEVEAIVSVADRSGIRFDFHRGNGDQDFHHAALYSQITEKSWLKVREGEAERDLETTARWLKRFPPRGPGRITSSVCAAGITNFSNSYIAAASELAVAHGGKFHIHAARDREEIEFSLAVHGKRPIEYLDSLGVLGPQTVLAHAMLATPLEMVAMGRSGCGVAHSAVECINILNAVPDVPMMRALGITVGLGCDNAVNDMFEVMRSAWLIHGATRGMQNYDPEILRAEDILAMATVEGAKLLGLDGVTGSLEVGKAADFIVVDGNAPHLFPTQDLIPELVRYGTRSEVRHVFVDGVQLVRDGELTSIDVEALRHDTKLFSQRARDVAGPRRYRSMCAC